MNKYLKKDFHRRKLVCKYERKKMLLKAISNNIKIPLIIRMQAQKLLSELPRDASKVRIKNRSPINGKSRANFRKYGIDRITFKNWTHNGWIPGCTSYSW